MVVKIEPGWQKVLTPYFESEAFVSLADFVRTAYEKGRVYPPGSQVFASFNTCTWDNVRVVIMGQDPYPGQGQAHGFSFSVPEGVRHPPSLQNIFKELSTDLDLPIANSGSLVRWAEQGVLLLNAVLTVAEGMPNSHQSKGWEGFTDYVIERLSSLKKGLVFMLWGSYAQRKGAHIDREKHLVLETSHPSPFSADRGFLGCKHFSSANAYLEKEQKTPIQW